MVNSYIYNSFGKIVKQTGTIANPYTYTGREFDSESGLYYYRARYYDAVSGRFLTEDELFLDAVNLYIYVDNDPLNMVDPLGFIEIEYILKPLSDFSAGVGDVISFGGTRWVRQQLGTEYVVDTCSGWYTAGEWTGVAWWTIFGTTTMLKPFTGSVQTITHWNTTTNIATGTISPGSWVMTGGQTLRNFWFAGIPFKYAYRNAITTVVTGSALKYPSGLAWIKGLLGQRIYMP